ncbi:hypothetical protein FH972_009624 [Carpinus fangiana]|uniref:Cytosine-specific methyltransferase n=1 Tax=Carpinus fangiana TaxID=176857 RepID=A0A660KSS4_9ROSI|nr:hypothetical protein FH972_009624 [Carpinus fangiana]
MAKRRSLSSKKGVQDASAEASSPKKSKVEVAEDGDGMEAKFLGEPVTANEAKTRWPKRYQEKKKRVAGEKSSNDCKDDSEEIIQALRHYTKAKVDGGFVYGLGDDAHVKAGEGEPNYICKIVEMFEAIDGALYFTAQWYYRARDTVIKDHYNLIDDKRVFFSKIRDDNPLDCLVKKLNIVRLPLNIDLDSKRKSIQDCDYYCDMLYLLPYSTFVSIPSDDRQASSETSTISSELEEVSQAKGHHKTEVTLLDLYSGCGAMSTGLCLGANLSGLNLVTKWAVDINEHACKSLKQNHPETEVRNEPAEDFLLLLKEWEKLCVYFSLGGTVDFPQEYSKKVLLACPSSFISGFGESFDNKIDDLRNCRKTIKDFVTRGYNSKILPLPGDVDVICGGPPCQGISGFNRFRNKDNPLEDEKNKQLEVYMNLVQYLKPKHVLMENVVDIVKFANGFLGRYALGRLIAMNYQVRLGMMAAGAYGLPQFRMRVFVWGACPNEKLPQYPLPTHDVVVRGVIPLEFEMNTVAHDEGHNLNLEEKLLLEDAISDLPAVGNYEQHDEMPYDKAPKTEFQRFIRLGKDELLGASQNPKSSEHLLYDHCSLKLNDDDYQRVSRIPKRKGANFRDLPGVRVRPDKKVEWDPDVERIYLDSGKPLVPDYAMTFVNGSSTKPFGRLWWDETVPTVVTRAEPHNQAILHPEQDRVLTIRENARLQGFPDYYKLCGPVKERYIQVGNAVAVPVARALGYALGSAFQASSTLEEPLFRLPQKFPNILERYSSAASEDDA